MIDLRTNQVLVEKGNCPAHIWEALCRDLNLKSSDRPTEVLLVKDSKTHRLLVANLKAYNSLCQAIEK